MPTSEELVETFKAIYLKLAHRIFAIVREKRSTSQTLLGMYFPTGRSIGEDLEITVLAKQLYDKGIFGEEGIFDTPPWTGTLARIFTRYIQKPKEFCDMGIKEAVLEKLLLPLQVATKGVYEANVGDDEILEWFVSYAGCWMGTGFPYEIIVPLINLDYQAAPTTLLGFKIIAIPEAQQKEISRLVFRPFALNATMPNITHALVRPQVWLNGHGPEWVDISTEIQRIIGALRLLKPEMVGYIGVVCIHLLPQTSANILWNQPILEFHTKLPELAEFSSDKYILTQENMDELVDLLPKIEKGMHALNIPLHRYHLSYTRETLEDQVIDLTICLESCLLADEPKNELTMRLALRGATLLKDVCSPVRTLDFLKATYDIRSKIVHGGKRMSDTGIEKIICKLIGNSNRYFYVGELRKIVRLILREQLNRLSDDTTSLQKLCKELDNELVGCLLSTGTTEGVQKESLSIKAVKPFPA